MDLTREEMAALLEVARNRCESYNYEAQQCEEEFAQYWANKCKFWERLESKLQNELPEKQ